MKLNWDKKQMEEYYNTLINKRKPDIYDAVIINLYDSYINNCYNLTHSTKKEEIEEYNKICLLDQTEKKTRKDYIEMIEQKCDEFCSYYSYLPKKFLESLIILITSLGKLYFDQGYEYKLKPQKITDMELKLQSYEIFNEISEKFIPYLDYVYKNKLIKVKKSRDIFSIDSCCFFDMTNNSGYAYINKKDGKMESVYNHELMHSITLNINKSMLENSNYTILTEAHPIYIGMYTNKSFYEKTNNLDYLKDNYNYLDYLKEIIVDLNTIFNLIQLKSTTKLTKNKIENLIFQTEYQECHFNEFAEYINSIDAATSLEYLTCGIIALSLLDQDSEKSKKLFTDSIFNDYGTFYKFLKKIEFNLKDPYYSCNLFNETQCEINKFIRKRL